MSDPNLILKDTGSVKQTNRLVCMYAETIFQHEQTLCLILIPKPVVKINLVKKDIIVVFLLPSQMICKMVCEKFPTSTVIIASLDVETMIECDRIMVMEGGRIVELHEPHALLQVHYGR